MNNKKFLKKFLTLLLLCTLLLSEAIKVQAKTKIVQDSSIHIAKYQDAKKVVYNFVNNEYKTNDSDMRWRQAIKIKESTTLFNLDDGIAAYLFEFQDKTGADAGYIIVNTDKKESPIIEFGYTGSSFLQNAKEEVIKALSGKENKKFIESKYYYLGDMQYYVSCKINDSTEELFDVSYGQVKKIDKNEVKNIYQNNLKKKASGKDKDKDKIKEIEEMWSFLQGSTPPDSGSDYITNPDLYESSWQRRGIRTVPMNYLNSNFFTTTNFNTVNGKTYSGHCYPTAGTNLMMYWYGRDTVTYQKYLNGTWQTTFTDLYKYMNTNLIPNTGTSDGFAADGLNIYMDRRQARGYAAVDYVYSDSKAINEIIAGRPFLLGMSNHYRYNDHAVLALGYIQFSYSSSTSTYLKIADGWTTKADRYVWSGCSGDWNIVTFTN